MAKRWDLAGAALAVAGDILILGRAVSGPDFDSAVGVLPSDLAEGDRWRSLGNGVVHSPSRVRAGTVTGVLGIGLLSATGLLSTARTIAPGRLRSMAYAAAATFAVAGTATHVACGSTITAHRLSSVGPGPAPNRLLMLSAAGSLLSLATLSGALTAAGLRGLRPAPTRWSLVGPFPPVALALLTFGHLPRPLGGYARPASISLGLLAYFLAARQPRS